VGVRRTWGAVALASSLVTGRAWGDDVYGAPPPRVPDHDAGGKPSARHEGDIGVEGFGAWYPRAPQLLLQGGSAPRDLVGFVLPATSTTFVGVGADMRAYGFLLPGSVFTYLGLRYSYATGGLYAGIQTANGAPLDVRTQSMNVLEITLPWWNGFAFSNAANTWRIGGTLNFGAAYAWGSATLTSSRGSSDVGMHRFDLFIRPEADACLHVTTSTWACAHVTYNVREFDWGNGGSAGVRLDFH
jgi:hypothetical protein